MWMVEIMDWRIKRTGSFVIIYDAERQRISICDTPTYLDYPSLDMTKYEAFEQTAVVDK